MNREIRNESFLTAVDLIELESKDLSKKTMSILSEKETTPIVVNQSGYKSQGTVFGRGFKSESGFNASTHSTENLSVEVNGKNIKSINVLRRIIQENGHKIQNDSQRKKLDSLFNSVNLVCSYHYTFVRDEDLKNVHRDHSEFITTIIGRVGLKLIDLVEDTDVGAKLLLGERTLDIKMTVEELKLLLERNNIEFQ
jgi:hypothetical protein